jgi:exonuclease III
MTSNSAKENLMNVDADTAAVADNADPDHDVTNATKRQKIEQNQNQKREDASTNNDYPRSYVTWNCNGFSSRAKNNQTELQKLLDDTNYPDVICIQEARLKASGPTDQLRGQPLKDNEYRDSIQPVIENIFIDYHPFWSLADKKYAGTLTLIHRRCYNNNNNNSDDDFVAFTPQSAIDLLLRRFNKTRSECGLESSSSQDADSATVASNDVAASSKPKKQQASLKSFFAPKKDNKVNSSSVSTTTTKRNSNSNSNRHRHNVEGRFQYFFFQDMDVVQTYVPNNGSKEESFQRRRNWDRDMLRFMMDRKKILLQVQQQQQQQQNDDRKLLWIGDMNVANEYQDGTHWEHRQKNTGSNNNNKNYEDNDNKSTTSNIYEWWTDEKKCLGKSSTIKKNKQDIGMPGFTQGERDRFREFLNVGDFCDIWRELHPMGIAAAADSSSSSSSNEKWGLSNYTWRGQQSKNPGGYAKYQGRGQRIDYFLLSPASKLLCCNNNKKQQQQKQNSTTGTGTTKVSDNDNKNSNDLNIDSCDILGYGTRMEGLFCGSDHCAVKLTLS